MFDTVSVFDALELDNTGLRVASRRALALAHNRVERNLGSFLRAAQSEEEFFERLALLQEEFDGYVTTASAEVGHEHPEHIAAALKDHYRLAADKAEFVKTPEEEEEEKEKAEAVIASLSPKKAKKALKKMAKAGRSWSTVTAFEGKQGSPLADAQWAQQPAQGAEHFDYHNEMGHDEGTCPECGSNVLHPETGQCMNCGHDPYGTHDYDLNGSNPAGHLLARTADMYTGDEPSGHKEVTCPECGGDGKTAGATACGKCKGKGKVPNFGDSVLDAYFGKTADDQGNLDPNQPFPGGQGGRPNHVRVLQEQGRQAPPPLDEYGQPIVNQGQEHPDPWMDNEPGATTFPPEWAVPGGLTDGLRGPRGPENPYPYHTGAENQNNTDLDGPEPKMDKRLWTPGNPGRPDYQDGSRHPTKEKDPTEVIGPARNDHELSEISGTGEHCVKENLPTQGGDKPFADNNMEMAPHTDTFGNDGQVDPVSQQSLESVQSKADDPGQNPLVELLRTEWPNPQAVTAAFLQ